MAYNRHQKHSTMKYLILVFSLHLAFSSINLHSRSAEKVFNNNDFKPHSQFQRSKSDFQHYSASRYHQRNVDEAVSNKKKQTRMFLKDHNHVRAADENIHKHKQIRKSRLDLSRFLREDNKRAFIGSEIPIHRPERAGLANQKIIKTYDMPSQGPPPNLKSKPNTKEFDFYAYNSLLMFKIILLVFPVLSLLLITMVVITSCCSRPRKSRTHRILNVPHKANSTTVAHTYIKKEDNQSVCSNNKSAMEMIKHFVSNEIGEGDSVGKRMKLERWMYRDCPCCSKEPKRMDIYGSLAANGTGDGDSAQKNLKLDGLWIEREDPSCFHDNKRFQSRKKLKGSREPKTASHKMKTNALSEPFLRVNQITAKENLGRVSECTFDSHYVTQSSKKCHVAEKLVENFSNHKS